MKIFRRRWPVIVLCVLVAASAAWIVTEATSEEPPLPVTTVGSYGATIVLWDPGAETIGRGNPITSPAALAHLVDGPNVAAIAAQVMYYQGDPKQLLIRVESAVDPATGFLTITGIGKDPASAQTIASAFSTGLTVYLTRLKTTQINQQRRLLQEEVAALEESGAKPIAIETLHDRLAKLAVKETTPISLTEFQRQPPIPRPLAAGVLVAPTDNRLWVPESTRSRVLLAALLGLLVGIVIALLLERFDTRIRSSEHAEEAFGMPVLAEVPAIPVGRREGVVMATHPYSRAGNAFRLVQTGTARWRASQGATTILVTSPEARDGKTTIAANLAAAYAQAGNRVLVVSCDLRRPAIHEMFGLSEEPGLTDALRVIDDDGDWLDLPRFLKPCSVLRVAVLPSGRTTDRPSEILGSAAMQQLGERLKRVTDVVILDCAPLVVAGDVVPLLALADGVVVVARGGKTRRGVARSTATLLERYGLAEAGVVLNDAREFSIPLAKRNMYRPSRKVRKAAETTTPRAGDEDWVPKPDVEPPVVDEPAPEVEPSAVMDEPRVADEQDEIVRIPDAPEPSASPVEEGSRPRVSTSKGIKALRKELKALRAELDGVQIERSDEPPADPAPSFPVGFRPGSGHEA